MVKKKYEEANIEAIADSIREKTGIEKTYKTKDMAEGVGEVYEAGNEQGLIWAEDTFIHRPKDYSHGWRYMFTNLDLSDYTFRKTFKPKSSLLAAFYNYRGAYLPKNMDFSEVTGLYDSASGGRQLFTWATSLKKVPDLGLKAMEMGQSFNYLPECEEIECVRILETHTPPTFVECNKLVKIAFEGVIGKSISFPHSPLSVASLKNIIKHLKNYSGIADHTQTLTVKASAWEALEAEGLNDEDKAWLISLMPYVEDDIDFVTWAIVVDFFSWNLVLA